MKTNIILSFLLFAGFFAQIRGINQLGANDQNSHGKRSLYQG